MHMRPLARILISVAALAAVHAVSPAASGAPAVLDPETLPRGADIAIPHLQEGAIVDGALRVRVPIRAQKVLGRSRADYIVGTGAKRDRDMQIVRIAVDGSVTTLVRRARHWMTQLSDDGERLVTTRMWEKRTAVILRSSSGDPLGSRTFRGRVTALDIDGNRVLLERRRKYESATLMWMTDTNTVAPVSRLQGYLADLSADVMASYTKSPYIGGCSVVSRISTGLQLWKSCAERVAAFNADGSRLATQPLLIDPEFDQERIRVVKTIGGEALGDYTVERPRWFGDVQFESSTALLLETAGDGAYATIRCTDAGCERASELASLFG